MEGSHRGSTENAEKADGPKDDVGGLPGGDRDQVVGNGCKEEGADAGPANRDPGGEGATGLKVEADTDDGGEVDEAEAKATEDTIGEHQNGHGGREGGQRDCSPSNDSSQHADRAASKSVDQPPNEGTREHVGPTEEAANPGYSGAVGVKVFDEGVEEDAEGVGDPVEDEVTGETCKDDDPAPASVRGDRDGVGRQGGAFHEGHGVGGDAALGTDAHHHPALPPNLGIETHLFCHLSTFVTHRDNLDFTQVLIPLFLSDVLSSLC